MAMIPPDLLGPKRAFCKFLGKMSIYVHSLIPKKHRSSRVFPESVMDAAFSKSSSIISHCLIIIKRISHMYTCFLFFFYFVHTLHTKINTNTHISTYIQIKNVKQTAHQNKQTKNHPQNSKQKKSNAIKICRICNGRLYGEANTNA